MVPNKLEKFCFNNLCASCCCSSNSTMKMLCIAILVFGAVIGTTSGDIQSEQSAPPARIQQCREGCLQKSLSAKQHSLLSPTSTLADLKEKNFATEDFACLQGPECSMCWDQCAEPPSKINKAITNTWVIRIVGMFRQGSLVATDIKWPIIDPPSQCLVTWEVSGGGLMGNLLTDSNTVQLSLWPETRYRVQVTCKNKKTEVIGRSLPLTIDTRDSIIMRDASVISSSSESINTPDSTVMPTTTTVARETSNTISDIITTTSSTKILSKYDLYKLNQKLAEQNLIDNDLDNNFKLDESSAELYDYLAVNQHQNEIILGIITAILVFGIFILLFILNLRRNPANEKIALLNEHHSSGDYSNSRCVDDPSQTILHSVQTVHV